MAFDLEEVGTTALRWMPSHRLIASRFPTVGLYDAIADPDDLEVIFSIEGLTNPRIRQEMGALSLVPPDQRVSGPGSTLIMAAFTHLNAEGSRFSDGSFGIYYAAKTLDTAVAEVSHHRSVFLSRTSEPEGDIDLRWIQADIRHRVHDVRATRGQHPRYAAIHDPDHYGVSQELGLALRKAGSVAMVYDSVRHAGGECVAVFVPRVLAAARPAGHLSLHWDGQRITHWFEKGEPHDLLGRPHGVDESPV